jgi:hypothetical protein
MPVLVEERDRREDPAPGECLGPAEEITQLQSKIDPAQSEVDAIGIY